MRNEAETRAELIDPAIKAGGWGEIAESRVGREYQVTPGRRAATDRRRTRPHEMMRDLRDVRGQEASGSGVRAGG